MNFEIILHKGATEDVPAAIRQLQGWLYPEYTNDRLTKAPSRLLVVFGDTWPDEQWVLRRCEIARDRFDKDLNCILAYANLELVEYIDESIDAKAVRRWQN